MPSLSLFSLSLSRQISVSARGFYEIILIAHFGSLYDVFQFIELTFSPNTYHKSFLSLNCDQIDGDWKVSKEKIKYNISNLSRARDKCGICSKITSFNLQIIVIIK
jgi:hypothetical protein